MNAKLTRQTRLHNLFLNVMYLVVSILSPDNFYPVSIKKPLLLGRGFPG